MKREALCSDIFSRELLDLMLSSGAFLCKYSLTLLY